MKKLSSFLLALKKKKKKKKREKEGPDVSSILSASCQQVKAGVSKGGESVWGLSPELLCWGGRGFWGIYGQRVLTDAHLNVAKTI